MADDEQPTNQPNQIVIITYRLEENEKLISAEEVFLEYFFKISNEKFEVVKYHSSEITSFLGKLPCLYFNKNLILNKDIPNFIYEITTDNNELHNSTNSQNQPHESHTLDNKRVFDNILYVCREELRINNEYYSYLKHKMKLDKSKNIWTYFTKNLYKNEYYEHLMSETIKNHNTINPSECCIENIKNAFNKLNTLKANDLGLGLGPIANSFKFTNNQLLIMSILLYSFLKEDKFMFIDVKRPEIENLKYEEESVIKSLEAFFNKVDRLFESTISGKVGHNLSIDKEKLVVALQKYCMSFDPIATKEKNKKQREMSEIQNSNNWKYNLFSIGMFLLIGSVFFFLSTRKEQNSSKTENKSNKSKETKESNDIFGGFNPDTKRF